MLKKVGKIGPGTRFLSLILPAIGAIRQHNSFRDNDLKYNSQMRFRTALIIYFAVLTADIVALATGAAALEIVAKPALMLILLFYFTASVTKPRGLRRPLVWALFLSWLGDIFLLADKHSGGWFVFGLGAFLGAHVAYIYFFIRARRMNDVTGKPNLVATLAIVFYSSALFMFVMPFVAAELIVPVAVYTLVLTTMLISSVAAFNKDSAAVGRWCITGTAVFVVSDSILAINRFAVPFTLAQILVMATYGTAQFLITEGALKLCNFRK